MFHNPVRLYLPNYLQPTNMFIVRSASDNGPLGVSDEASSQRTPRKPNKSLHRYAHTRERNFHELLQFVRDRTGRVKVVKAGQVSATAWLRLFQLSSKAEHLEAVTEAFSQWRESGKSFSPLDAEMFVRTSATRRSCRFAGHSSHYFCGLSYRSL
jgi:hypothetical protein